MEPTIAQKTPIVQEMKAGTYFWCACGKSAKQPFCDGSHTDTTFLPVKVVLETDKKVAWCGCKHSGNGAFCDGTHKNL